MTEFNRNFSYIYEVEGNKIVSKRHQKPIFLRRELFFYDLFQKTGLVRTPEIYEVDGLNLKTRYIETGEKDILRTVTEWANVHSYFMANPIVDNPILLKHDIKEVISFILLNKEIFGKLGSIIENALSNARISRELTTVIHGDLCNRNMITYQGQNYYFDFELGGIGHPGRDVASMIISDPDKKREIEDNYLRSIDFYYPNIKKDINTWVIARASQLYLIFDRRSGSPETKKKIKNKLSEIIQDSTRIIL